MRLLRWQYLAVSIGALLCGLVRADAGELKVKLRNGTVHTGVADRSTDASWLRIRYGTPTAYIIYGIDWRWISEIRDGSQLLTPEQFDQFRQDIVNHQAPEEPDFTAQYTGESTASRSDMQSTITGDGAANSTDAQPPQRVQYIEFDAIAGSWDADVEWDGIQLRVRPIDQWGQLARVRGTVTATLFGSVNHFVHRAQGKEPREPAQRLGHWVRRLTQSDYEPTGDVLRLEFQNFQPERRRAPWHRDLALAPHGELHVQVTIPGQGVFSASTEFPLRLRRFSSLRDQHFIRHGTRFFPSEL